MERFQDDVLDLLTEAPEIEVETIGRRSGLPRRTIVWVVVADEVPYVRSEYGDAGQWYRNALAEPRIAIHAGGRRVEATATRVAEPETWRLVSEAFRAKYRRSGSLAVMVDPEIEPMTLAFTPMLAEA